MADAKKPGLEIVLGMGKPKPGAVDKPEKGGSKSEAAQSILDAVKSDDASSLMRALDAFIGMADMDDEGV
jgi:hypothetical protein